MADHFTKDIRGTSIEQRRYRNKASKWKYSGPSNSWPSIPTTEPEVPKKLKPMKAHWRQPHKIVNHNKGVIKDSSSNAYHCHASRVHGQIFARLEAQDSDTDIDLSPRGSESLGNLDEIYYSFDADASPASSLGLDNLVDHAEALYKAKETDKLVKDEYEVLDEEGEAVKHNKKRSKKAAKPSLNTDDFDDGFEDVDGDWETI